MYTNTSIKSGRPSEVWKGPQYCEYDLSMTISSSWLMVVAHVYHGLAHGPSFYRTHSRTRAMSQAADVGFSMTCWPLPRPRHVWGHAHVGLQLTFLHDNYLRDNC